MHNIKIRDNNKGNFCPTFPKIRYSWSIWWSSLSNTDIYQCDNAEECILLGFGRNENFIHTLNLSILIAKQCIYYQRLTMKIRYTFDPIYLFLVNYKLKNYYVKKKITTTNLINSNLYFKTFRNTYIDMYFHLYSVVVVCVSCLLLMWGSMCSTSVMSSEYMLLLYLIFHFSKSNIFVYNILLWYVNQLVYNAWCDTYFSKSIIKKMKGLWQYDNVHSG